MTRYAVGDLQGCLKPLQCLLEQVTFNPKHDQLWLVGDLINRGPDSLATLRFLYSIKDSIKVVLGNHDLHFLAIDSGATHARKTDTFEALFAAPDRQQLSDWLRQQPLFYCDPSADYVMSHAGIAPHWTIAQAQRYANEVQQVLQSDQAVEFFKHMYGNNPDNWNEQLRGWDRLRTITNYFTRMRFCGPKGELDLANKSNQASAGFHPWFKHPARVNQQQNIIFGHWAALEGKADTAHIFALDTGCVWGNTMTLLNLETQTLLHCQC